MIGKISDDHASMEAASLLPKQMNNPPASAKDTPEVPALAKKRPVFVYSRLTLPPELLENIDEKWEACWPINMLRPLVLLDLISYLLFIKKLEDLQLISGLEPLTFQDDLDKKSNNKQLSGSSFRDMDPKNMHKIFLHPNGLYELIKNYSLTNLRYSVFLREPLLLTPTTTLLKNILGIMKIMEAEDQDTNAAIFEYLLNKAELEGQTGQVYAPDYVVKLMIEMVQPASEDLIWDPSAGNGCFLVNSAKYIAAKNTAIDENTATDFIKGTYHGIECDPVQLRIGAMNMILHGIEDPKVECINIFEKANKGLRKQPTLILCNLFFEGAEEKITTGVNALPPDTARKDVRLLHLILNNLKKDGRAAVITRESLMNNHMPDFTAIRQELVDHHKLEAVISLPNKAGSLFCGANILIFTEEQSIANDKVWFYKIKQGTNTVDPGVLNPKNGAPAYIDEYDDIREILARWKNEKEDFGNYRENSFYVSIDEIKNNNYNLSFGDYRRILINPKPYSSNENSVIENRNISIDPVQKKQVLVVLKHLTAQIFGMIKEKITDFISSARKNMPDVAAQRKRLSARIFPVLKRRPANFISIIAIAAAMFAIYFVYFNNKNRDAAPMATKHLVFPVDATTVYPTSSPLTVSSTNKILTPAQIQAILQDTSGIIHFADESGEPPDSVTDGPSIEPINAESPVDKKPGKMVQAGTSQHLSGVQYTVRDTTFFHNQPDEKTSRKSYLDPLNHNILKPIQDTNGFIYIVYTNHFGRTSTGWINKKDLVPLQ
ncbi:MAG: N-6 DNA methylase [Ginsengibacter sp.]